MSSGTPAVFTTAPSGARLPNSTARPPVRLKGRFTVRMTSRSGLPASLSRSDSLPVTVGVLVSSRPLILFTSLRIAGIPPERWTSSMCTSGREGLTLHTQGVLAEILFSRARL